MGWEPKGGGGQLKEPVDTYSSLPLINNTQSDIRSTQDTNLLYIWSIPATSGTVDKWISIVPESSLKDPVATYNDLPLTDNTQSDMRSTQDTDLLYIWSVAASSGTIDKWLLVPSSFQWDNLVGKPTSSVADIDAVVGEGLISDANNIIATQIFGG